MDALISVLAEIKGRLYESFYAKPCHVDPERPLFSVSFDDVPISAVTRGVPILEKFGIKATFYAALNIERRGPHEASSAEKSKRNFTSVDELRDLHRAGHHIGCHTYSHYRLASGTAAGLAWDALKNRLELSKALDGVRIDHFAYPFGEVSFRAKHLLEPGYLSMRTVRPGINSGRVDLNYLRAVGILARDFDRDRIQRWIDLNGRRRGWLIFYTHGVDPNPEPWDCLPDQLAWVIDACQRSGGEIRTVAEACAMYVENGRKAPPSPPGPDVFHH